jgi:hypothetical protein
MIAVGAQREKTPLAMQSIVLAIPQAKNTNLQTSEDGAIPHRPDSGCRYVVVRGWHVAVRPYHSGWKDEAKEARYSSCPAQWYRVPGQLLLSLTEFHRVLSLIPDTTETGRPCILRMDCPWMSWHSARH